LDHEVNVLTTYRRSTHMNAAEALKIITDTNKIMDLIDEQNPNGDLCPTVYDKMLQWEFECISDMRFDKELIEALTDSPGNVVPALAKLSGELVSLVWSYNSKLDDVSNDLIVERKQRHLFENQATWKTRRIEDLEKELKELKGK